MTPPFIIYGLPRSRTFWLSKFLTYGDWVCGHDEIRHMRSLDDVKSWLAQPCVGSAETAGASWWRLAQKLSPDIRTLVVRRPVGDVVDSLMRMPLGFDRVGLTTFLISLDRKLDQIEHRVPGTLSVRFNDLRSEEICRRVFEHCLPYKHDPAWWQAMDRLNLQVDMRACIRHYQAFKPQLENLGKIAKHVILSDFSRDVGGDIEGVTMQYEPFETFYRDAQPLFDEHLIQVGEAPGDHAKKNLPILRAYDAAGCMQVTTARSNGRIFGYLMAVLSPALDDRDGLSAVNMTFFADKAIPRLGMKLQRTSLNGLRKRGATEVFWRAGTRGDGPRLGTICRRLGAEPFGELYRLNLKEA